jgi:hydrogenase nickel incorporation protein HypA/HybF
VHEYSIVQALLARVEQEARARHATSVHRLSVRIGELSGVEPQLLASAYEVFRERTLCDGADLVIESVPARWVCSACEAAFAPGAILTCADCGAPARLAGGDEILLERIEMEVP